MAKLPLRGTQPAKKPAINPTTGRSTDSFSGGKIMTAPSESEKLRMQAGKAGAFVGRYRNAIGDIMKGLDVSKRR